jgi:myo-inositol-1(or 4)-monophosphatase
MENLAELLAMAERLARAAGDLLATRPAVFDLSEKSSAVDFATQMDIAAEKLIVDSIIAARPHDAIIGEEGSDRPGTSGITWVIDPVDGTVNYFYGIPGWNVSVAAKDASGVLVGAVYSPATNSFWSAARGMGATFNGKKISCNNPVELEMALLATGFAYDRGDRIHQARLVSSLLPRIRDFRRNGAAAVDLCYVAMGALDGYFESGLKEWDLAAGGLIAREAGAIVSGDPSAGEIVIAAGPALHPILEREIQALQALKP